jgi:hypothetical protein
MFFTDTRAGAWFDLNQRGSSFSNAPAWATTNKGSSPAPDDVVSSESCSEKSVHRRPLLASSDVPRGGDGARVGEVHHRGEAVQ